MYSLFGVQLDCGRLHTATATYLKPGPFGAHRAFTHVGGRDAEPFFLNVFQQVRAQDTTYPPTPRSGRWPMLLAGRVGARFRVC